MRPRLLHLGSDAHVFNNAGPVNSFNEAEAFTPRIRKIARRSRKTWPGFNEAEAFTPRIPYTARLKSSEGPSSFNEAEAFTPRIRENTRSKERRWNGFNEAEAFTPRIPFEREANLNSLIQLQ